MFGLSKYRLFLVLIFIGAWIAAAIKPLFPHDWLLENFLVFLIPILLIIFGKKLKWSDTSYTLLLILAMLHLMGSHYTYEHVPFGDMLGNWLGFERNMYDRLVHFLFGLLMAYPAREIVVRLAGVRNGWSYYLPVDIILSLSALYEIIEWISALRVAPELGMAFLGAQGDVWDAQTDMALAGTGAIIAMILVWLLKKKWSKIV